LLDKEELDEYIKNYEEKIKSNEIDNFFKDVLKRKDLEEIERV
jgi:23S rRNA maturation-related 3'-5' exoribonuclease YhaM